MKLGIITFLLLGMISCGEETNIVEYRKVKGMCGESWGTNSEPSDSNEESLAIAESYFRDSFNIEYSGLRLDSVPLSPILCIVCFDCPSDLEYVVQADLEDRKTLAQVGFDIR